MLYIIPTIRFANRTVRVTERSVSIREHMRLKELIKEIRLCEPNVRLQESKYRLILKGERSTHSFLQKLETRMLIL